MKNNNVIDATSLFLAKKWYIQETKMYREGLKVALSKVGELKKELLKSEDESKTG